MFKLADIIKSKQNLVAQHLLSQIDNVGITLNQLGVTNKVNRHALIGQLWIQKYRLEGEKDRFEMFVNNSIRPIKKIRCKLDKTLDDAIDYLPAPLAKRAHRTHDQLRRISGG